jgi:hypothetical protein
MNKTLTGKRPRTKARRTVHRQSYVVDKRYRPYSVDLYYTPRTTKIGGERGAQDDDEQRKWRHLGTQQRSISKSIAKSPPTLLERKTRGDEGV